MPIPTPITMIDYGASNIRSAQKAFEYLGAAVQVTDEPKRIAQAEKLVLPGVGAFGAGMQAIRAKGLDGAITAAVGRGAPLLGICLGMQFLFDKSDEMGEHTGLGLIPGQVTRFDPHALISENLKIPHMGWNQIEHDGSHPLLNGVPSSSYCYFVHSYFCQPADLGDSIGQTDHGQRFTSIVGRERVFGLQFHPEKSQQAGLEILRNYLAFC